MRHSLILAVLIVVLLASVIPASAVGVSIGASIGSYYVEVDTPFVAQYGSYLSVEHSDLFMRYSIGIAIFPEREQGSTYAYAGLVADVYHSRPAYSWGGQFVVGRQHPISPSSFLRADLRLAVLATPIIDPHAPRFPLPEATLRVGYGVRL